MDKVLYEILKSKGLVAIPEEAPTSPNDKKERRRRRRKRRKVGRSSTRKVRPRTSFTAMNGDPSLVAGTKYHAKGGKKISPPKYIPYKPVEEMSPEEVGARFVGLHREGPLAGRVMSPGVREHYLKLAASYERVGGSVGERMRAVHEAEMERVGITRVI